MGLTLRWAASAALFISNQIDWPLLRGISFEGRVEWKADYRIGR